MPAGAEGDQHATGARWSVPTFVRRLGRPCCTAEPRTKSVSLPGVGLVSPKERGAAPPAATDNVRDVRTGVSTTRTVAVEEARDVLHPLPSLNYRNSAYSRSNRSSVVSNRRQSKPSVDVGGRSSDAGFAGNQRTAFPSRTMGSLTAWQMLAADVQKEMEAATQRYRDSRESELSAQFAGTGYTHPRSSQVERSLVMSEGSEGAEVLLHHGEAGTRDALGPGSSGHTGASGAAATGESSGGQFQAEFEVLGELGHGAFGCALKARRRADSVLVCVKVLDTQSMGPTERRMTRDEVRVLSSLQHPNIVRYDTCFYEGGQQYISMEFCEEGDLEKLLKARGGSLLSEEEVTLKFVQLCLALQHVHSKGIIHRDIKSSNIFVSRHGILKLGDFGISKALSPGKSYAKTMVGTPYYFSPEVVEDKPYNKKSDVWSAGCVLYELATLQRPFRGGSVSAIAVKILRGTYAPLPEQYSPELHQLVSALLRRKPEQRPSINELLSMPYMRAAMRRYRDYVQQTVENRKASYYHSLDMYNLDARASAGNTAAALPSRLSTVSSQQPQWVKQEHAALSSAAPVPADTVVVKAEMQAQASSDDMASALAAVAGNDAAACLGGSVVLQLDMVAASGGAGDAAQAARSASSRRVRAPRHSTFSAVQHMQTAQQAAVDFSAACGEQVHGSSRQGTAAEQRHGVHLPPQLPERRPLLHDMSPPQLQPPLHPAMQQPAQVAAAKQPALSLSPVSPRSMLYPSFSSLETTASGSATAATPPAGQAAAAAAMAAAAAVARAAALSGPSSSEGEVYDGECCDVLHPHFTSDYPAAEAAVPGRAADSVRDLMRRVPALMDQVQHLLDQHQQPGAILEILQAEQAFHGAVRHAEARWEECDEDVEVYHRRPSRRAAVQECLEELYEQLPPPCFPK